MPDIGTADVKPSGLRPSGFTSQQCQYLAYSPCCHAITNTGSWVIPCQINTKKSSPLLILTKLGEPVSSIRKPLHTKFQLLKCYSFSTATNLILASGAHFRPRAMTEIPISSDVINVESCNKDFLEALERLFHLAYNNLMFDLIKVQRLRNLTFDLGSGKTEVLIFFKLFLQRP